MKRKEAGISRGEIEHIRSSSCEKCPLTPRFAERLRRLLIPNDTVTAAIARISQGLARNRNEAHYVVRRLTATMP